MPKPKMPESGNTLSSWGTSRSQNNILKVDLFKTVHIYYSCKYLMVFRFSMNKKKIPTKMSKGSVTELKRFINKIKKIV